MVPLIILSILLIAVGTAFLSSVVTGFVTSTTSSNTKNRKIRKIISNSLPSGGQLEPNQSIQSQDGSYILKNEGNRLVLLGPDGEVVNEWMSENENSVLSVSYNGTVSYGDTIIHQGTDGDTSKHSLGVTNNGELELSNSNGSSEIIRLKWTKLGDDIPGVAADDRSGKSVSLSSDGKIVAIGAPWNDNTGHVRVYEYNEDVKVWTQLGSDIVGEVASEHSGHSVSLSSDGKIVAIGAPENDNTTGRVRVFEYINGSWTKLGLDIPGVAKVDYSGGSVSLSENGKIVAIGAIGNDGFKGCVRVYEYDKDGDKWDKLGSDIPGAAEYDYSGGSVSLSENGKIVAIGAIGNDDYKGCVSVYEYKTVDVDGGIKDWTKLGSNIPGEENYDNSGHSVSLSSDGKIVAIGAIGNDSNGEDSGCVRVYEYINGSWTKLGLDIPGVAAEDESGWSVSLSSDGKIVAIGARYNDGNGTNSGHVRVFEYNNNVWKQLGLDIPGAAEGDLSGYSVSLSDDGKIVAIGATRNDNGNDEDSGHVSVYKLI